MKYWYFELVRKRHDFANLTALSCQASDCIHSRVTCHNVKCTVPLSRRLRLLLNALSWSSTAVDIASIGTSYLLINTMFSNAIERSTSMVTFLAFCGYIKTMLTKHVFGAYMTVIMRHVLSIYRDT